MTNFAVNAFQLLRKFVQVFVSVFRFHHFDYIVDSLQQHFNGGILATYRVCRVPDLMGHCRVHLRHDHLLGALLLDEQLRRLIDQLENGSLIPVMLYHLPLY